MSYLDFKTVNCRACGKLIWTGHSSAGFLTKLDTPRLSVLEEITKKVSRVRTYEAHRTLVSFEVTPRTGAYVIGSKFKPERVILAEHECSTINQNVAQFHFVVPDYWNRDFESKVNLQEVPF